MEIIYENDKITSADFGYDCVEIIQR